MSWLTRARGHNLPTCDPRFASVAELNEAFAAQSKHLLWLAEVITGDTELAPECVVDARRLLSGQGMFRDWLLHWARSATVRSAACCAHERIAAAAARYTDLKCAHGGHPSLTAPEVESLKRMNVAEIVSALDTFSRAVLVLRGVQGVAVQECALALGVSRSAVTSAYCGTREWMARAAERDADVEDHKECLGAGYVSYK